MNKRFKTAIIIGVVFIFMCIGLIHKYTQGSPIADIAELNNKNHKVGILSESYGAKIGETYFADSNLVYFHNDHEAYNAIRSGKVEMLLHDKLTSTFLTNNYSDLAIFPQEYGKIEIAMAAKKGNDELINQVNDFITEYQKGDIMKTTYAYWLSAGRKKHMPKLDKINSDKPKLIIGTNGNIKPYSYLGKKNELIGADIEIAKRLGIYLNREIEFKTMTFSELIKALDEGKIDLIISNLNITEDRQKVAQFSKPYTITTIVPVIKRNRLALAPPKIDSIKQLEGAQIGVLVGSVYDTVATKNIKNSIPVYYNTMPDMNIALQQNKVKALILDEPIARSMQTQGQDIEILLPFLKTANYALGFSKNNQKLRDDFSRVIDKFREDGTLKEIDDIWFGDDESKKVLPEVLGENRNGVLKLGVDSVIMPFAYVKNNQIVGYEIDLVHRIGKELGYQIEVQDMNFAAIIPSLVSSKINVAASCMEITPERQKSILFSSPSYQGGVIAAVNAQANTASFSTWTMLKSSAKKTFIDEDRYKLIVQGLNTTLIISFFSVIFGSLLGFIICFMRRSRRKLLCLPARVYISVVQGTPLLVLLMILFYIIFANVEIDAVLVAIIAFTIDFAAYAAEMFRSGIDAVDKGQIEAAGAIGFNRVKTFVKITFPQALKHILPVYRGEVISTIKMTSIVGYIAIQDLTKMSDIIRSRTYEAFFPLISTAVIYFALAYIMAHAIKIIEFKINPLHRKRVVKGINK